MGNIADIVPLVRPFVPQCPDPTIIDAVNRTARIFCNNTWYVRRNVEFDTVANVSEYNITNADDLELIAIKAAQITGDSASVAPLTPVPLGSVYPAFAPATPLWYQFVPYNTLVLYPTPDTAYSVKLTLIVQPTTSTESLPDELINKWRDGIAAGARAWLSQLPGQSWTDFNVAQMQDNIFKAAISNAKAEVQRSYLPGAMRARPRAFVVGGF